MSPPIIVAAVRAIFRVDVRIQSQDDLAECRTASRRESVRQDAQERGCEANLTAAWGYEVLLR